MKIEAITLREIQMPLVHFFETSFGRTNHRRILLLTAHCEGVDGWGECVAGEGPFFSAEWTETAWHTILQYLAPAVLELKSPPLPQRTRQEWGTQERWNTQGPESGTQPQDRNTQEPGTQRAESGTTQASGAEASACVPLMAKVRGHRMAKAAIEQALWDAEAKQKQQPLWKLLGGTRREIACGVSIGIQDSVEQLLEKIVKEVAAGYRRIKLKVKPGWDLQVLERVRSHWPEITLSCDANSAYGMDDVEHLRKFDQFNLLMIEQPLWQDDIYYHARLQRELRTAICLDESIRHARDAAFAIEIGACRIVNIKSGRVGGLTEARKVHDVCAAKSIPVWCGGMLESGIGRAHNVALSTLENFSLPGDVSASKRYWKEDIVEPEIEVSAQGMISVSNEPGIGHRIREDLIEKLTVRKKTVRAGQEV